MSGLAQPVAVAVSATSKIAARHDGLTRIIRCIPSMPPPKIATEYQVRCALEGAVRN
jgi:hypothetical protein